MPYGENPNNSAPGTSPAAEKMTTLERAEAFYRRQGFRFSKSNTLDIVCMMVEFAMEEQLELRAALSEQCFKTRVIRFEDLEKVAQMMLRCSIATGHGDTIDDLLAELEAYIVKLQKTEA